MVMPEQTHLDGKVWIGADDEYQVDIATGQWTKIDYLKMQPPGARDHGSYGVAADSQNNFYGLEVNADFIIRVDAKTLIPTYYQTPTANSGPRRGHFDNQDRLWFAENRGQNIGMFDAKAERFREWKVPTPYAMPYDAIFDNSTYAWTGGSRPERGRNLKRNNLRQTNYTILCGEIKLLFDGFCGERFPAIDFAHVGLAGSK
jgi:virginiamycin B lyase